MTDGTTLTHTSPLAELHPDAPITITWRQLVAACRAQLARSVGKYNVPKTHAARWTNALDTVAAQDADQLLQDIHTAAQQLQADAGVPA